MNETNKVSVIVPAYNVERYIEKCLKSILNQTYKNIEIIVVNDGSIDSTGAVVEKLANSNSNIRFIDTTNQGVSAARNIGIQTSTGEYITFVDADDYLAADFVSYMVNIMDRYEADFCISRNCFTRKDEKQIEVDKIIELSREDALVILLSPQIIVGCWNKMYRRSTLLESGTLFNSELYYGEGLSFITRFAQISTKTVLGERRVYYYRRNNETSATTKFDINKLVNGEKSLINIRDTLTIHSKRINQMWNHHMCLYSLGAVVRIKTYHKEQEYSNLYLHWKKYLRKHAFDFILNRDLSLYRKMLLVGGWFCPGVLVTLDVFRRKRIIDNSIL